MKLFTAFSLEVPEAGIPAAGNDWLVPEAGIPAMQNDWFNKKVITQKHNDEDKLIEGTYVHQDLIPHIASWVSIKFAMMVSRIVREYIVSQYKVQAAAQQLELHQ